MINKTKLNWKKKVLKEKLKSNILNIMVFIFVGVVLCFSFYRNTVIPIYETFLTGYSEMYGEYKIEKDSKLVNDKVLVGDQEKNVSSYKKNEKIARMDKGEYTKKQYSFQAFSLLSVLRP